MYDTQIFLLSTLATTVEIAATQYNISEAEGSATITIRTSALAAIPISVTLTTIDGSAVGEMHNDHGVHKVEH